MQRIKAMTLHDEFEEELVIKWAVVWDVCRGVMRNEAEMCKEKLVCQSICSLSSGEVKNLK